jgi:hypothetical protein
MRLGVPKNPAGRKLSELNGQVPTKAYWSGATQRPKELCALWGNMGYAAGDRLTARPLSSVLRSYQLSLLLSSQLQRRSSACTSPEEISPLVTGHRLSVSRQLLGSVKPGQSISELFPTLSAEHGAHQAPMFDWVVSALIKPPCSIGWQALSYRILPL